jgi:hypothetical protein
MDLARQEYPALLVRALVPTALIHFLRILLTCYRH